jgi:putative oxidoreductase
MKDFIVTSSWYQNWIPVIARILLAAIFIMGGVGKLMGFEGSVGFAASAGVPFPDVAVALALVIELLGGIFLLVGFKTRVTAMILSVHGPCKMSLDRKMRD